MNTLYFDCSMGAAGDMLTAALLELLPEPEAFVERLNSLPIPGVRYNAVKAEKCGVMGTHIAVTVDGEVESHPHEHHHTHYHHHSGPQDEAHLIDSLGLPDPVAGHVRAVYEKIALAESAVHGVPVESIHFHEVGTLDAVADVTAVCLLMEELKPEKVVVSPIHVGSGQVVCAHGILPVPAPATLELLKDVPIYAGDISEELCTPTGAALLTHFAASYGPMPLMRVQKVGYGMGKKDLPAANCVRALLGESV